MFKENTSLYKDNSSEYHIIQYSYLENLLQLYTGISFYIRYLSLISPITKSKSTTQSDSEIQALSNFSTWLLHSIYDAYYKLLLSLSVTRTWCMNWLNINFQKKQK